MDDTSRFNGHEPSRLAPSHISAILHDLESACAGGRKITNLDRIVQLRRLAEAGGVHTLEMLLPLALRLNGEPYHLGEHFPFSPVFRTKMPKTLLLVTGRQVSKSTSIAARGIMQANCVPNFRILYVTPLYEQIRRFSNNYVRPFIDTSPIKSLWSGTSTENSVLQRSFKNLSKMLFSFALLDVDRIRGISCDTLYVDEIQDMDPAHLPIMAEAMSHSDWDTTTYTGTPKSLENPIYGLWQESSQAEWIIPCHSCGTWNIPSREFHIDAMLGPLHEGISEKCPATVCHRCRKSIHPRHGHWVHRYPDRRFSFAGYHVPQIIMPLHYSRYDKWAQLLAKREGWGNTSTNVFYNEVLGESIDAGQKLVTETELQQASVLPWKNVPNTPDPRMTQLLPDYRMRVLGVDWGGGGVKGVSFTAIALLGFRPDGKIDCLWGKRLVLSQEHLREAREIMHWMKVFKCDVLAHDYTGAGIVRETVLVQAGFELNRVMPIQYIRTAAQSLIRCVPPTILHNRAHYRLDKPRSLLYTCQAIKLGLLRFFEYDAKDKHNPGLIKDFLSLIEEMTPSRLAGNIYTITRNITLTDDFAHAVNLGCAAIWHTHGWPDYADAAAVARISSAQLQATGSASYGWDEDREMRGIYGQP